MTLSTGLSRSPGHEPFDLESFDPEPFGLELMAERLTTEGLMAERLTTEGLMAERLGPKEVSFPQLRSLKYVIVFANRSTQ